MREFAQVTRTVRVAVVAMLLAILLGSSGGGLPSLYAQSAGATLTVLRGGAAVLRSDGTPLSPAASGLTLGVGDQVATLASGSALVTFFDGSEIELGAETTIILREMAQRGSTTTITVESVIGSTLHRVVTLTDPSSSYRVDSGGTVALVRGTVFAHRRESDGDTTVAVGQGVVDFPSAGQPLTPGQKRTVTSRGDSVNTSFDPATPLLTTVGGAGWSGQPPGNRQIRASGPARIRCRSSSRLSSNSKMTMTRRSLRSRCPATPCWCPRQRAARRAWTLPAATASR